MADTEIALYSPFQNIVNSTAFEIQFQMQKTNFSSSFTNFSNEVSTINILKDANYLNFTNEANTIKTIFTINYINNSTTEQRIFSPISFYNESSIKKYSMRARKVIDNSFVYWRSTNIDSVGQYSGFSINELKDICIIAYN